MLNRPIVRPISGPLFQRPQNTIQRGDGLNRGPELVVNGNFSDPTAGWELIGFSITGGRLVANATAANNYARTLTDVITTGKWYEIKASCKTLTQGGWKLLLEGGTNVFGDQSSTGDFKARILSNTTGSLYMWANSTLTASFDDVSVRELIGYKG